MCVCVAVCRCVTFWKDRKTPSTSSVAAAALVLQHLYAGLGSITERGITKQWQQLSPACQSGVSARRWAVSAVMGVMREQLKCHMSTSKTKPETTCSGLI